MKKKVLVLGSAGMLGHITFLYLSENPEYQVFGTSRSQKFNKNVFDLDVLNQDHVKSLIDEIKPDVIVNCIGVLISGSNKDHKNAIYINSYLPHFLAEISTENNIRLIHVSTDCVFSGSKGGYTEKDEKDGKDVYAKSKALGEIEESNHLTLRTSIIGPELKKGEGLLHWLLSQTGEINGYKNAWWSGVSTLELAKVINISINSELGGIYHVTNGEKINKYDMLHLFKKTFNKTDISILPFESKFVDKSIVDTRKEMAYQVVSYSQMMEELIDFMKENKEIYHQYLIDNVSI